VPACVQHTPPIVGMGEDCLTLNVYTPTTNANPVPVMIWIHGGSFTSGSGGDYNPVALVAKGLVVVTINYRLGPFAFLQSPLIQQENPTYPTLGGMNGIADQHLAISWVKSNAQFFGGDPSKITLFGESAGSLSLNMLVTSPRVESGTFLRVIFESGSSLGPWGPKASDLGITVGTKLLSHYNATTLEQLRGIPALDFLSLDFYSEFTPSVDGYFLPNPPSHYFQTLQLNIPQNGAVVVGSNSLDTLYTFPFFNGPFPQTPDQFLAILKNFFGEPDADKISQVYPCSEPQNPSPRVSFQLLNAHLCVVCPTRQLGEVIQHLVPVYLYEFGFNPVNGEYRNLSAHFGEVPLVFGFPVFPFAFDQTLSDSMTNYWAAFALSGIPSSSGDVAWPEWKSSHMHIQLNLPVTTQNGFHDDICGFWTNYLGTPVDPGQYLKVAEYCFQAKISQGTRITGTQ